jgi:hypothetical protein
MAFFKAYCKQLVGRLCAPGCFSADVHRSDQATSLPFHFSPPINRIFVFDTHVSLSRIQGPSFLLLRKRLMHQKPVCREDDGRALTPTLTDTSI